MEDFSEMKLKLSDTSGANLSETPRLSLHDSNSDLFLHSSLRLKSSSFISPKRQLNSGSFLTSHTRSGSSFISPPAKSSFIQDKSKDFSIQKLDEKLNKISEDLNTERNALRDTGIETIREKLPDLLRDSKTWITTDRSTLAKQLTEDYELNSIPTLRWCAYCARETSTEVEYRNSSKTFLASLGIFLMGGVFGCFLIPYVTTKCKDMKFICHVCKREVS